MGTPSVLAAASFLAAYQVVAHSLWAIRGPAVQRTRAGYFRSLGFDAFSYAAVLVALLLAPAVPKWMIHTIGVWVLVHVGYIAASLGSAPIFKAHEISSPSLWHRGGKRLPWVQLVPKALLVAADVLTYSTVVYALTSTQASGAASGVVLLGALAGAVPWTSRESGLPGDSAEAHRLEP